MRLTSSRAYTLAGPVPRMPPGLVVLMEGLTKDVLKNNPSNVYEFCANHMEKLLNLRDGPSSKKSLTLKEKIAIAQEKVRQKAKERQQLYDKNVLHNGVDRETPENMNTELNLRAPVHQDQELSLSSEVEISHEPTYNSLTSKDSNFDESDEIPISKSSTFSSVSKSTVIDLTVENDFEKNSKEEDEIKNDETSEMEIKQESGENEGEFIDKNAIIEISKRDANNEKPVNEIKNNNGHKDEITIKKNIEQSIDNTGDKQDNIELIDPDNSDEQIVKYESDPTLTISDEDNHLDNLIEVQPSIQTKSNFESEHELNEDINAITEDEKHSMATQIEVTENKPKLNDEVAIEVPPSIPTKSNLESEHELNKDINAITEKMTENEIHSMANQNEVTKNRPELNDEVARELNSYNEDSKIADNKISVDNHNEISSIDNVDDGKLIYIQENIISDNTNAAESIEKSAYDNSNSIDNFMASVDTHTINTVPNESAEQVSEVNDSVKMSEVKVVDEENKIVRDSMEKKYESKDENLQNAADEQTLLFETNICDVATDDLEKKHSITFSDSKEKLNKEDNATSNSASLQTLNSSENNDDSVIGSDLSKAEDDMLLSDENSQNNMDLETAAVTIQKVFRSFLFKSRNSTFEDITNDEALEEDNEKNKEVYYATTNVNKERRPLGITRMDTVLQTVNEEKSLSLSTDDSSTLSSAATTIQAHVRGFLVRNKLNSYKTISTNSLVNSNEMLDTDAEHQNNRTVLNIHIVPGESNYLSRDESLITSMELSLDGSPPSSVNLHPLSYDLVSERRKLLKREDAIQSVSPPSNNSGKLSEDSVKEVLVNENFVSKTEDNTSEKESERNLENNSPETLVTAVTAAVAVSETSEQKVSEITDEKRKRTTSSDESDVITPFVASPRSLVGDNENTTKLIHSGEFHDVVLPTNVSRSDTTVVREFKNVLVYILLWNNS